VYRFSMYAILFSKSTVHSHRDELAFSFPSFPVRCLCQFTFINSATVPPANPGGFFHTERRLDVGNIADIQQPRAGTASVVFKKEREYHSVLMVSIAHNHQNNNDPKRQKFEIPSPTFPLYLFCLRSTHLSSFPFLLSTFLLAHRAHASFMRY